MADECWRLRARCAEATGRLRRFAAATGTGRSAGIRAPGAESCPTRPSTVPRDPNRRAGGSSASTRLRTIMSSARSGIFIGPRSAMDISSSSGLRSCCALLFPEFCVCTRQIWATVSEPFCPIAIRLNSCLSSSCAGTDFDHRRVAVDLGKQRRIGAGHPHLGAELREFRVQRRAPRRIEMRDHLVEQQHRREAGHLGDQTRMREHEADQQRLLLAGRGFGGGDAFLRIDRPKGRSDAGRRASARRRHRARDSRAARRDSAPRPRRRDAPGSAVSIQPSSAISASGNAESAARSRARPRAGARFPRAVRATATASLGGLVLDGVEPVRIGPRFLEQPVARAQRPIERVDPAGMLGIDRERQAIEKAPPLRRRADEQRIHRRHQPDHAQMIGERRGRGDRLAVDPALRGAVAPSSGVRSMPVPSVASPSAPSTSAATAQEPSPSWNATSSSVARRKPRPGARNEIASIRLVLPAPFGPYSTIDVARRLRASPRDNCGNW